LAADLKAYRDGQSEDGHLSNDSNAIAVSTCLPFKGKQTGFILEDNPQSGLQTHCKSVARLYNTTLVLRQLT
jgi:hypothetical protein